MKYTCLFLIISVSSNSFADDALLGEWKDKSHPDKYQYEFSKNNDFTYTRITSNSGKRNVDISKGVWEIGAWEIVDKKTGDKRPCNLTVYAETDQCCFKYKFISNNLILTNEYSTERYGSMCESRVLIRPDEKNNK